MHIMENFIEKLQLRDLSIILFSMGMLHVPVKFKTLTTLGDRTFAAAAPQLWNSLPYLIRSSRSVASFKKTLKTFLFQKAFL